MGTDTNTRRVYVDMVGDLFHAGHVDLLRQARARGTHLIVGVLSDQTAAGYKRPPIMSLAERVEVIGACRFVDQVIADAPMRPDAPFLTEHAIDLVVHGDDLSPAGAASVYAAAQQAGILELVPRTRQLSTTDVIGRVQRAVVSHDAPGPR